ncbi:MAG: hypothetical protein GEU74_02625 [Nitriliruptorales bacterium]|nr:hypothetical protein [Nitriliruptorales bacterium]
MTLGTSLRDVDGDVDAATVRASDVLIFRRAGGGHFVLTGPPRTDVSGDLLLEDEPLAQRALGGHIVRVAAAQLLPVCAGYLARAAAVVAVDRDVIVVLGRRDGCMAGVGDAVLVRVAVAEATAQGGRF